MSNHPPLFKNFGKSFSDLLDKKFDFDTDVKVKTSSAASGLTFETTARSSTKSSDFIGLFKGVYKRADVGTIETNFDTNGKAKFSFEADKFRPGFVAKFIAEQDPIFGVDLGYTREYAAVSAGLTSKQNNYYLDSSLSLGYEGLSVGAALKANVNTSAIEDFNIGTQYSQPDFTVALKTSDMQQKVLGSYIHNVNPDVTVGGSFAYNMSPKSLSNVLSLVTSYALDRDTSAKLKFSSNGTVTGAWEQRLFNPKVKVNLAAEYLLKSQGVTPEKIGLGLSFGD